MCMLIAVVGAASAFADDGEQGPELSASSIAGEGATTDQEIASQLTDQQAAAQLPHQDLDRNEALQLMKSVFDIQLQSPAGPFNDLQVDKFLSDTVAVVSSAAEVSQPGVEITGAKGDDPYTGPALIESTVPMRTENEAGKEEAVDLSLEHDEGELQSENPLVEVGIPQEIGEGVALADSGVQIELPSAPEQIAPSIVDQSVAFFPNVATDTDLAIAPTPEGVETLTQIRSAAAPLSQTFHLDLPAGAELQGTAIGGAEVKSGTTTLVNISPAGAIDASGKAVPTEMEISGNALTLSVSPAEDVSYPILLDPVYAPAYIFPAGKDSAAGTIGTDWISGKNTNALVPQAIGFGQSGLEVATFTGSTLALNDQANWFYRVPRFATDVANKVGTPSSWIAFMSIRPLLMSTAGGSGTPDKNYSPYLVSGIWDETALVFQASYMHGGSEPDLNNPNITYNFYTGYDPHAKAALGVALLSNGSHQMISNREVYAGGVLLSIADEDLPEIAPIQKVPVWVNQTATTPFKVTASDTGLGVSRIIAEQTNSNGSVTAGAERLSCAGSASEPCPRTNTFSPKELGPVIKDGPAAYAMGYNPSQLPQGINYIKFSAEDTVGNKTAQPTLGQVRVDHTAPLLTVAGTATEQMTVGTTLPQYSVKGSATDGTAEKPQSGVASLQVTVDGKAVDTTSPGCSTETCSLSKTVPLNNLSYSVGKHTVVVTTTDAVGLSTSKSLTLEVQRDTVKPQLTSSGGLITAPEGWVEQKSYKSTIEATDPKGFGITSLNFKIDGKTVSSASKSCEQGACSVSLTPTLNMASYPGGAHSAEIVAKDGAGNTTTKQWTINVDPDGMVTGEEATDTLEALDETAETGVLTPSSPKEIEEQGNPGIFKLKSTGTDAPSEIAEDPAEGYTLETPYENEAHDGGDLQIVPTTVSTSAGTVVVNEGVAGVAINTQAGVDSIVRPIYDGIMSFDTIRESGSPSEYSWEVQLDSDQKIVALDSKSAQVVYSDGTAVAMIKAIDASDATGKEVPTVLGVKGNIITLTVSHKGGGFVYPILAGHSFEIGYGYVEIVLPPPPPSEEEGYWESGETIVGPPEPIPSGEASASTVGASRKQYVRVICGHSEFYSGGYREACGNPFKNEAGFSTPWQAAVRGAFLYKPGEWVEQRGAIACDQAGYDTSTISYYYVNPAYQCHYGPKTSDGNGGATATAGHYLRAQAHWELGHRGKCPGTKCEGSNNPIIWEDRAIELHLWPSGAVDWTVP